MIMMMLNKVNTFSISNIIKSQPQAYKKKKRRRRRRRKKKRKLLGESVSPRNGIGGWIPQSSSTLWNYSKCGVYTAKSEAGC
jgi:hypothetical protein